MKVISTATNITQGFKNAGRVKEIVSVLVRHGFSEIISRMKLERFLPSRYSEGDKTSLPVPERLRLSFEELGTTFIKLGQVLALRSDLLPEAYTDEFQKLQDDVPGVPFPEIKKFLENEYKKPLEEIFLEFEEKPLAAASIAQVHGAKLKTGELVAVKIQRPGIDKIIQNDVSILRGLAYLLERYIPEVAPFNPQGMVDEFFKTILYELDFRVEANNIRKIKNNLKDFKKVEIPLVYNDYSTSRVLVLQRFEGIRFSDREAILKNGSNPMEIIETGCDAFFNMVMKDGIFHGDLHPGNLFVLKDGKIGIIDFGIVGRLSRRVQNSIITMFVAIMDEDYESLASEYLMLCPSTHEVDMNQLQKDLMDTISPYVGMALGEVNVGVILLRSTSIAARHHLVVPRELMLLFKALVTMDGLGKKLDPNFDILQLGNRLARQVLSTRYSKDRLTRDLVVFGRDLQDTLETFPRLLKRYLRTWSLNNFSREIKSKQLEELNQVLRTAIYFGFLGITSFSFMALGVSLLHLNQGALVFDVSLWGLLSLLFGVFLSLHGLWIFRGLKK